MSRGCAKPEYFPRTGLKPIKVLTHSKSESVHADLSESSSYMMVKSSTREYYVWVGLGGKCHSYQGIGRERVIFSIPEED